MFAYLWVGKVVLGVERHEVFPEITPDRFHSGIGRRVCADRRGSWNRHWRLSNGSRNQCDGRNRDRRLVAF